MYDAVVAIRGGYVPYGPGIAGPAGASGDAAVIEAAYRTLTHYFPNQTTTLDPLYAAALAAIADGSAKTEGQLVGQSAASLVISLRTNDGRMTPVGTTSAFPKKTPGPGVWRLTPPSFSAPQTPRHSFCRRPISSFLTRRRRSRAPSGRRHSNKSSAMVGRRTVRAHSSRRQPRCSGPPT